MPTIHGKEYMNPAYGRAIAEPPEVRRDDSPPSADAHANEPIGTAASGYAGPENGPCRCGDCIHFDCAESSCDHPIVVGDDEIKKLPSGLAHVDADGYCDFFRPPEPADENEPLASDSGS